MSQEYGDDFITITDEDGVEYGEELLCAIEDDEELEQVYQLLMDQMYEEDELELEE